MRRAIDATVALGGTGYVFWGGREGYSSLINTDMKQEREQLAVFLRMAVDYAKKKRFKGRFFLEPKAKEPSTHQYDFDCAHCLAFLREFDLIDHFELNVEANHATLATHSFEHELVTAASAGKLGSLDINRGLEGVGWDTDNFPTSLRECVLTMMVVQGQGGLPFGGLNFDAKVRRGSFDEMDLFHAHIGGMDVFAKALLITERMRRDHAEQTPLCAERYAAAFEAVGAPQGVFQFLHLSHAQVADVVKDDRINFVSFTGSVEGGRAVQKAMSDRFIGLGLELGGKDPAYVRADADIENAVENLVDGAFFNSGQSCCGVERVYVHRDVSKQFIEAYETLTRNYVLGDPFDAETTLGPLVRPSAAQFVRAQIAQAIDMGAKTLIDPSKFEKDAPGTAYMAPQVVVDVDHRMDLMRVESFGPVVGIMTVDSDEVHYR